MSAMSVAAATSFAEERVVVHEFLGQIPTSHLAVLSTDAYRGMMADLSNRPHATFGFGMVNLDGMFFVAGLLEDGPAGRAGLLRGDRKRERMGQGTVVSMVYPCERAPMRYLTHVGPAKHWTIRSSGLLLPGAPDAVPRTDSGGLHRATRLEATPGRSNQRHVRSSVA